jgi:transcriptional regulator with XRE-family HTH domain
MEFGDRLLELAKHYDISVNAIAERASIKRTTLQTYMPNGSRQPAKPSIDAIVNIFRAFPEIHLEWLLTGDGLMIGDSKVVDTQIKLAAESNLDYKEKYYELTEKVITLQDELNESRLELINCLKSKIKMPLHARAETESIV